LDSEEEEKKAKDDNNKHSKNAVAVGYLPCKKDLPLAHSTKIKAKQKRHEPALWKLTETNRSRHVTI